MTNYGSTLLAITDGTSNTIMVAELRAGISPLDPRGGSVDVVTTPTPVANPGGPPDPNRYTDAT